MTPIIMKAEPIPIPAAIPTSAAFLDLYEFVSAVLLAPWIAKPAMEVLVGEGVGNVEVIKVMLAKADCVAIYDNQISEWLACQRALNFMRWWRSSAQPNMW